MQSVWLLNLYQMVKLIEGYVEIYLWTVSL